MILFFYKSLSDTDWDFFYFCKKSDKDLNLLEYHETIKKITVKEIENLLILKDFKKLKKAISKIDDWKNIYIKGKKLICFISDSEESLKFFFQLDLSLVKELDFYRSDEFVQGYKLIYYFIYDKIKFDIYLMYVIKNIKNIEIGYYKKNYNLIDMIFTLDLTLIEKIFNLNKKLFQQPHVKKHIKDKETIFNSHIIKILTS